MTRRLVISVRTHGGRYHGAGDGPPSPFRLFQALVAGAGIGGPLDDHTKEALAWFEGREAPVIAAPRSVAGQVVSVFMPNNDLDAVGGDARRIGKIRTATKVTRPLLFDASIPWLYAWPIDEGDDASAQAVCALSEQLYQLGRGVDMAWAWGELLDDDELQRRLADHDGEVLRPSTGEGRALACPQSGSLKSLEARHVTRRFRTERDDKSVRRVFVQPPKPRFRQVVYDSPAARFLFELRSVTDAEARVVWPLAASSALVVSVRDSALARLCDAMPDRSAELERYIVGRKADGSSAAPTEARVRIIPIPSIGMRYADRSIRRILVEVPAACPLRADDVRWAFSGAELSDTETGEVSDTILAPAADERMLSHYAVGTSARVFRTATPVVLPEGVKRRRIDPGRRVEEAKAGPERAAELAVAAGAVVQALRHADVLAPVEAIRAQREPFDAAGERAEPFAEGTRFAKERLWHVEIRFGAAVKGPLVIGDGRFLGLGIMVPLPHEVLGVHAFSLVGGLVASGRPSDVTRALRRAVMARAQRVLGPRAELDAFFSGHGKDGGPARRDRDPHLAFAFDPASKRLLVIAPHVLDRRMPTGRELEHLRTLDAALDGFRGLLAGAAGGLELRTASIEAGRDAIFGRSHEWVSATPYVVTRHAKKLHATEALAIDVRAACRRIGLPEPRVESHDVRGVGGLDLLGSVRLTFQVAVSGPIVLGRDRHLGGGLFQCVRAAGSSGSR